MAELAVLIPAAGQGERLGLGPKGELVLAGRTLLAWLVDKSLRLGGQCLIAVPAGREDDVRSAHPQCLVVAGGATRQDSVDNLLGATDAQWVLVQDVARPFASLALMRRVHEAAVREDGGAGAFLDPEVPVAEIHESRVIASYPRERFGIFQAPQAFRADLLREVAARARCEGWREQSTAQLWLRAGLPLAAVAGEKTNIKITTTEDWMLASAIADRLV